MSDRSTPITKQRGHTFSFEIEIGNPERRRDMKLADAWECDNSFQAKVMQDRLEFMLQSKP